MRASREWSLSELSGAEGKPRIAAAMDVLRKEPPRDLAGNALARLLDLLSGEERAVDGSRRPLGFPRSSVLAFYAEDGGRLIARPSGTEPKIKFYVELVAAVESAAEVATARATLEARCGEIKAARNRRLGFD